MIAIKLLIIASLKRKIKRLEEVTKELKEQIKISYADIYKILQYYGTRTLLWGIIKI